MILPPDPFSEEKSGIKSEGVVITFKDHSAGLQFSDEPHESVTGKPGM
jgi:hypothetical protein